MPNRVYRESGASRKTVKLGISARRCCVSSVDSINSIIGEGMVRSAFPGFPKEAAAFFRGLARNNNREWFLPRKPLFEEKVKEPMRQLVVALNGEMRRFAPLHISDPDKSIYRIYRDTRFS